MHIYRDRLTFIAGIDHAGDIYAPISRISNGPNETGMIRWQPARHRDTCAKLTKHKLMLVEKHGLNAPLH